MELCKGAIPDRVYFRIGDVAEIVGVKPYVLRYWESEFPVISPNKSATGQRVYRRIDVETLLLVKHLLYSERYSIEGARKRIKDLRKEGELVHARKEVCTDGPVRDEQTERRARIRELSHELQALAQRPVSDFFRY